ncbi:hypothetical protein [Cylindrospermopsis raciborskii]|uniref:hypothetical protein n=1 Tax=Cylindrospermopsis raciborskii TaxID=77022 RepID=UPI001454CFA9|nr:hypothetical protein [Cylindrospermopsis raciborskii]
MPCAIAPISLRRLNPKCDRTAVTMGDSPVLPPSNFPLRMAREVYWGTTRYWRSHLPTF